MKNNLLCLLIACSAMCFGADFNPKKNADKGSEVSFTENIGQVSDQYNRKRSDVLFSGTTGDLGFHLRKTGISYQFSKVESWKDDPDTHKHKESKVPDVMSLYRLDIEWEGANNTSVIEKNNTVPGYENFYLAACPEGITKVQSYKEIVYQNIYAGIDLYYYGTEGQLKYDFVLQPHADYRQIKGHVSGVNRIFVNKSGELVMETPFGTYSEKAPLVKQGEKVIKASWQVNGDYISYNIGAYDHNQELIIDPLVRVWGTFYGGEDQ